MSTPVLARPFSVLVRWTRPRSVVRCYASSVLCMLLFLGSAGVALASEPAVKALNAQAGARYDYTHVDSSETFQFTPPPTVPSQAPEEDIDLGQFFGIVTVPVGHAFGARMTVGVVTSKRHPDTIDTTRTWGMDFDGDLFWRDPEVGEVGLGVTYIWTESETGDIDRSDHAAGGRLFGTAFLPDIGLGPVDIDAFASFLDGDIDSDGAFSARRNYRAGGQATIYLSDRVAVGLGGSWSRTNFGTREDIENASADLDLDVLISTAIPITLGADVSIGHQEVGSVTTANFGRDFFSLGVTLRVSFADAASLLELNRFYY